MNCTICGAQARIIDGIKLCEEHKTMSGVVKQARDNDKFVQRLRFSRSKRVKKTEFRNLEATEIYK